MLTDKYIPQGNGKYAVADPEIKAAIMKASKCATCKREIKDLGFYTWEKGIRCGPFCNRDCAESAD